jgi:hypothetical protein
MLLQEVAVSIQELSLTCLTAEGAGKSHTLRRKIPASGREDPEEVVVKGKSINR